MFVLIYLSQSVLIIYLVNEKFDLEKQIDFQRQRISELEQQLEKLSHRMEKLESRITR